MHCPKCKQNNNNVIDSRLTEGGSAIRRRRQCQVCERRFTTKERVEDEPRLGVVKTSGQRVRYDREKIVNGIARACYKLDIDEEQCEKVGDRVEEQLFANHDREVTSEQIGAYVGEELRLLHPVAYVRFMSIYRKYSTVDEFIDEIRDVHARAAHDNPAQQSLFDK